PLSPTRHCPASLPRRPSDLGTVTSQLVTSRPLDPPRSRELLRPRRHRMTDAAHPSAWASWPAQTCLYLCVHETRLCSLRDPDSPDRKSTRLHSSHGSISYAV